MADDNRISIEIALEDGKTLKGLAKLESAAKKTGLTAGNSIEKSLSAGPSAAISSLKRQLLGVGTAIVAALGAKKVIAAAAQEEVAINKLNTSLSLAGTFSKEASKNIQAFADQIQASTTIGNEAVLTQVALARNYTTSNEQAVALTKSSIDLAAATGMSLDSAVKNLGKTFAGLTGELGESLPIIRTLTVEQLKAGGAISLIAKRFGGAAIAAVRTFNGAMLQAGNSFTEFAKSIGRFVTQSPVVIALIKKFSEMFFSAAQSIKGVQQSGDILGQLIIKAIKFGEAVNLFIVAPLEMTFNAVKIVFDGIRLALQGMIMAVADAGAGLAGLIQQFDPNSGLAQGLLTFQESSKAVFDQFSVDAGNSIGKLFDFDLTMQSAEFLENMRLTAESAKALSGELKDNVNNNVNAMAKNTKKASFDMKTALGGGIASAIQQTVGALARGENAFEAFGKAVLGVFGDLAIQLGTFFIINGIAVEALKSLGGAAAIAAGVALIALGALLKSISGSSEGGAAVSAGQPGSGEPGGGVASSPSETTDFNEDEIDKQQKTEVRVNVQGSIFDTQETGLRIVGLINEAFDSQGAVVATT